MGRGRGLGFIVAAWGAMVLATAAGAEAPDTSLLPKPNPVYAQAVAQTDGSIQPLAAVMQSGPETSLRPKARPKGLAQTVAVIATTATTTEKPQQTASAKGAVCGVAAIKGAPIAPIKGTSKGCGLQDGVRVTSVSGVRLSMAITVDCPTAKALNAWVRDVVQPSYDGKVAELKIAGHYTCRSRNNQKGAKISEHGHGKAVDVAGFLLRNGKVVSVAANFNKTLRRTYKAACGIFGTTLGPGSDGYHEDHMHFDTASYRSGPYCR